MPPMNDRLFVAIAQKTGFPPPAAIAKLRVDHPGRTLHEAAVTAGVLAGDERARFEKIAAKFARGDRGVIQPKGSSANAAKPPRRRRAIRQSSMSVAALPPLGLASTAGPPADPTATASGSKVPRHAATPSGAKAPAKVLGPTRTRVDDSVAKHPSKSGSTARARRSTATASGAAERGGLPVALWAGGAGLVVVASVIVSVVLVLSPQAPPPHADASPTEPLSAPSSVAPTPVAPDEPTTPATPTSAKPTTPDKTARTLREAEELELEGKEDEADALFEVVLESTTDASARSTLTDARTRLVERLRARIGEIDTLASGGRPTRARRLLAAFRMRFPAALKPDLDDAQFQLDSRTGGESHPANPGSVQEGQLARLAKIHEWLTRTLRDLDTERARAYFQKIPRLGDPALAAEVALDERRIAGIERLVSLAGDGLAARVGKRISLALRSGRALEGKLIASEGSRFVVNENGVDVPSYSLRLLAPAALFTLAESSARDPEAVALGEGVLLACVGDRPGALAQLARSPEAGLLAKAIEEDGNFVGPPLVASASDAPAPAPAPDPEPATKDGIHNFQNH